MKLVIKTNPSPYTLIERLLIPDEADTPEGYALSTEQGAQAWVDQELANGWVPAAQPALTPPIPQEVTRRQFFLAVHSQLGLTRAALRAQIGTESALIDFDEAQSFKRDYPLLLALAAQLGYTEAQIDQLFQLANTL